MAMPNRAGKSKKVEENGHGLHHPCPSLPTLVARKPVLRLSGRLENDAGRVVDRLIANENSRKVQLFYGTP